MLPYFEEYIGVLTEGKKSHISHLNQFHNNEKSVLDMNKEDLVNFFQRSYTTNCNVKNALNLYLDWLKAKYNEDITSIKYILSQIDFDGSNYAELYFKSLKELFKTLETVENEVMAEFEAAHSESVKYSQMLKTKEMYFLRVKAYYVLLWHGLTSEEMLSINTCDVANDNVYVPSTKSTLCIPIDYMVHIHKLKSIEETILKKTKIDNLFRTNSKKALEDTLFKAMGKIPDVRLKIRNVEKASWFEAFTAWEIKNNRELCGTDIDIILELCHHKFADNQVSVRLNEYHKYLQYV